MPSSVLSNRTLAYVPDVPSLPEQGGLGEVGKTLMDPPSHLTTGDHIMLLLCSIHLNVTNVSQNHHNDVMADTSSSVCYRRLLLLFLSASRHSKSGSDSHIWLGKDFICK